MIKWKVSKWFNSFDFDNPKEKEPKPRDIIQLEILLYMDFWRITGYPNFLARHSYEEYLTKLEGKE